MKYFDHLGAAVLAEWSKASFDDERLPDIAVNALRKRRPCDHVQSSDIVSYVAAGYPLAPQHNIQASFGEPPVTVYWSHRFFIEALFWATGTTTIHQHSFVGAFAVLEGSSVQSKYAFSPDRSVNAHFRLGNVRMEDVRLLHVGDVEPILSGASLTHSVFHLGLPSVTIVVRTYENASAGYQYELIPPNICRNPSFKETGLERQLQILRLLERVRSDQYEVTALAMLRTADLQVSFSLLESCRKYLKPQGRWDSFFATAKLVARADLTILEGALAYRERTADLCRMREQITDPDERFFLAILINVPDRDRILALVGERHPEAAPEDRIADWLDAVRMASGFRQDVGELARPALRLLVRGTHPDNVMRALVKEYGPERVGPCEVAITDYCRSLIRSELFGVLFSRKETAVYG
jgi:hypothetical protein